jgi:GDP-L-fucose synthase
VKILIFGSNGLVGNSLRRVFSNDKYFNNSILEFSTRNDTDLFLFSSTEKKIQSFGPDLIINAAAKVGGIVANNSNRADFLIENAKINLNILESARNLDPISIINLGSSCIYPLNAKNPIKEEYIFTGKLEPTNSPYAIAKLLAIELGNSVALEHGHKIINLMPTNLYGPNDYFDAKNSHVIPGLIHRMHQAKKNLDSDFEIWGTGKALREFLYVDDLALAISHIIQNNISESLINIGSNEEVSILHLAEYIKEVIEYRGNFKFNTDMPEGNDRKLLDSSIINKSGWKPNIKLKHGLSLTYSWYLENIVK